MRETLPTKICLKLSPRNTSQKPLKISPSTRQGKSPRVLAHLGAWVSMAGRPWDLVARARMVRVALAGGL